MIHNNGQLSSRFGGAVMYFVAQFASSFSDYGVFDVYAPRPGQLSAVGGRVGVFAHFGSGAGVVEMQVAISFISLDQARANLRAAMADTPTFDAAFAASAKAWATLMGTVQMNNVTGADADSVVVFNTAVYQTFMAPTNFTEAGGDYRGLDGKTHSTGGSFTYYTDYRYVLHRSS